MENEKTRKTSPLLALISPTQFILGVLLAFIAGALFFIGLRGKSS